MGCMQEEVKRKTYNNIKSLAQACSNMSGKAYAIYKESESSFNFCEYDEYTDDKGTYVCSVHPMR